MGSATVQGKLWGRAPRDWAEGQEPQMRPLYEATIAALAPGPGTRLLDAGCGSGLALQLAAASGATVSGLDATPELLAIARERLPEADLRVGDLEELPFDSGVFDMATAFNSLQYAADPKAAMAELLRVTRPGGLVAIGLWGDPARCQTETLFQALRALAPPPPGTPSPLDLSAPGKLQAYMAEAGLEPVTSGEAPCAFRYPDLDTAWRYHISAGPLVRAIEVVGEPAVREAFLRCHEGFVRPDGSVQQDSVFQYAIGRVPAVR